MTSDESETLAIKCPSCDATILISHDELECNAVSLDEQDYVVVCPRCRSTCLLGGNPCDLSIIILSAHEVQRSKIIWYLLATFMMVCGIGVLVAMLFAEDTHWIVYVGAFALGPVFLLISFVLGLRGWTLDRPSAIHQLQDENHAAEE